MTAIETDAARSFHTVAGLGAAWAELGRGPHQGARHRLDGVCRGRFGERGADRDGLAGAAWGFDGGQMGIDDAADCSK
jgi:hypothetical protein